jgi:D-alanyl-lipoteichoic acid acyltransferase DltB (MBOAT superfamily)
MFFNSLSYIVFLLIAVGAYWLLPRGGQWWLLLASIVFYGFWRVEYLALIVFSAFVDFYVSLCIHDARTPRARKFWLCTSIAINIGLLAYFKYTYFIMGNISMIGNLFGLDWHVPLWKITLPLGISFYTFVSLSYTIDIYRRLLDPVRNFGLYLTYVMFWPHMIAGPILRGHELITQIKLKHPFNAGNAIAGVKLIIAGLFLKVVLADQLAPLVDNAFSSKPEILGGLDVWTMAFAFGFQIYFDFAGYSLVAIGSARMLGIHFPDNFNWPYLATSPRDFWKRWHITLSSWVRDYLYLPLSGARYRDRSDGGIDVQVEGTRVSGHVLTSALFLSWFLMGLWHGASWNFALWGVWHAALIYIYRKLKGWSSPLGERTDSIIGWCCTLPAVMLAWIPFRAATLQQTFELLRKVVNPGTYLTISFRENFYLSVFLILAGMLLCAFLAKSDYSFLQRPVVRHAAEVGAFTVMIYFVFVFLKPVNQFIYFQF